MKKNDDFDGTQIVFNPGVILVPKGIDHVSAGTAEDCSSIEQIVITSNVKRVEAGAFKKCAPTTEVFLVENNDVVIEEGAFEGLPAANIHRLRVLSPEEVDQMMEDESFAESAIESLSGTKALNKIG